MVQFVLWKAGTMPEPHYLSPLLVSNERTEKLRFAVVAHEREGMPAHHEELAGHFLVIGNAEPIRT